MRVHSDSHDLADMLGQMNLPAAQGFVLFLQGDQPSTTTRRSQILFCPLASWSMWTWTCSRCAAHSRCIATSPKLSALSLCPTGQISQRASSCPGQKWRCDPSVSGPCSPLCSHQSRHCAMGRSVCLGAKCLRCIMCIADTGGGDNCLRAGAKNDFAGADQCFVELCDPALFPARTAGGHFAGALQAPSHAARSGRPPTRSTHPSC